MSDGDGSRRRPEGGEVEDRLGEQGTFHCPNCGPSSFQIKIENGIYKEICGQGCDYLLHAPVYILEQPDGSTKEQVLAEEIEIEGTDETVTKIQS
jgi:ribosomal protein S27AE